MRHLLLVITVLWLTACAEWVPLETQGQGVSVATAEKVQDCEYRGRTIVSVADRVAGVERDPARVAAELERLARNHAPKIGGDTIVPEGPVRDGERAYKVYRCRGQ